VHSRNKDIYKLVFKKFEGNTTGNIVFDKSAISPSGVPAIKQGMAEVSVYPNPVKDQLNIVFGDGVRGTVLVSAFDMTGRQVFSSKQEVSDKTLTMRLPGSFAGTGLYLLRVETGTGIYTSKFLVTKY
jgi:hypothetical protein